MSIEDNLKESLKDFLVENGIDAVEVVSFEDDTEGSGYCETCYYEYAVVRVSYRNSNGRLKEYVYRGGFSELIRELS